MIKYIQLFFVSALNLLFVGCACIPGGISSSNTPLHARPYTVIGDTAGTDSRYAIFGIIPVTSANLLKEAVKKAKGQVGADALIDITVDGYTQWWILFTRTVTRVDAKGIRFKDKWEGDKEVIR
ncbi:MAG: hypothetical protein KKD33_08025 [Verrucomicrobia bacterium]|nr:hypothetical protein [Verrucomicrobiota bacterium]MBU4286504.1 hypothetical protein [Verrucomicrobiota bacterium]MBU4365624.1 hypothetical protein [Verrucomicrobiota bacterium]